MALIQEGRPDHIPAIAALLVKSWKTHYAYFLPASLLEGLNESHQAKRHLAYMQGQARYFVAESMKGELLGFASFGKSRSDKLEADGELYTLYVDEAFIGQGIGFQLLHHITAHARTSFHQMGVFVMRENPFRSFYERNHFRLIGEEIMDLGGHEIANCMYHKALTSTDT